MWFGYVKFCCAIKKGKLKHLNHDLIEYCVILCSQKSISFGSCCYICD